MQNESHDRPPDLIPLVLARPGEDEDLEAFADRLYDAIEVARLGDIRLCGTLSLDDPMKLLDESGGNPPGTFRK